MKLVESEAIQKKDCLSCVVDPSKVEDERNKCCKTNHCPYSIDLIDIDINILNAFVAILAIYLRKAALDIS